MKTAAHYDRSPRKRFGQHFLTDRMVVQQILDELNPLATEHLAEIGPGRGDLTRPLLAEIGPAGKLDVIEIDRDLVSFLKTFRAPQLVIHAADALAFDFSTLLKDNHPLRLVGNLPYNISTPLIFHLLQYAAHITDMHFMLQKEVVDRLAAAPRSRDYGRLSVMVQYHCAVTPLFDVAPDAFTPPPRVDSAFVRLVPYQSLPASAKNYAQFATLVKAAFATRRKTLKNCLKNMIPAAGWAQAGIDPGARAEELTVEQFVRLANGLMISHPPHQT